MPERPFYALGIEMPKRKRGRRNIGEICENLANTLDLSAAFIVVPLTRWTRNIHQVMEASDDALIYEQGR